MDEIKALLLKSGISEEAAAQICEAMESYKQRTKTELDEEFTRRLKKAKQVCESETKAYKAELARRVQIFLESRSTAIEEQLTKQLADRDTEATSTLVRAKAVLENIEVNGKPDGALVAENTQLKAAVAKLRTDRNTAVQKANRLLGIAEKAVKRARLLESKVASATATPSRNPARKLDESRKGGAPQTTRRTLSENVQRTRAGSQTPQTQQTQGVSPEQIAAMID